MSELLVCPACSGKYGADNGHDADAIMEFGKCVTVCPYCKTVEVYCTSGHCDSNAPTHARIELSVELRAKIEKMAEMCRTIEVDGCFVYDCINFLKQDSDSLEYEESEIRIDYCCLKVYNDGCFIWRALEKHTDLAYETAVLNLSMFPQPLSETS